MKEWRCCSNKISKMASLSLRHCLISVLLVHFIVHKVNSKPTDNSSSFKASKQVPVYSGHSLDSSRSSSGSSNAGRKVLTSLQEDGTWQASARLPTSTRSGGNEHSRYKIRRDGSLSLSLKNPKQHHIIGRSNNKVENSGIQGSLSGRSNHGNRQFSPSELRSFSVVISDVDVTGNYNKNVNDILGQDSYSKAGVSSYHLKSNSIHRMNASWKLKPGHLTPSSNDLLEFLSYFANSDSRATRSEVGPKQRRKNVQEQKSQSSTSSPPPPKIYRRKILGQKQDTNDQHFPDQDQEEKMHTNQPFLTWSESSRNIPLTSSTELIETMRSSAINETFEKSDATMRKSSETFTSTNAPAPLPESSSSSPSLSPSSTEAKVLHDLLSTLEELNESVDASEKKVSSEGSKNVSVNHAQNNTHHHHHHEEKEKENSSQLHSIQTQTELDQARKPTSEEQVHLVDERMTESLQKKVEKEGELFVGNDTAKTFDSNDSKTTTHNFNLTDSNKTSSTSSSLEDKGNIKRNAKSAFSDLPTKSTNRNDDDREDDENEEYDNNKKKRGFNSTWSSRSTSSATSPLLFEMGINNSSKRMKIADPLQTASDLKKLMSLILKSEGNRNVGSQLANTGSTTMQEEDDRKSGAQVVNIVITPNQDTFPNPSESPPPPSHLQNPQMKINGPQKILFLKTPQVKQMLDIALTDPAVSSAAQKIAAALQANSFPNPIPANIDHIPSYIVQSGDDDSGDFDEVGDTPSTPNGFPLSGNGFLNMNHPNLQFHQALHHMIVNGTTPTTINATTKTNIINIFVINFKESNALGGGPTNSAEEEAGVVLQPQVPGNHSPFRINIKPSHRPKLPLPISVKPLLIESVSTTPSPHRADLSSLFFNNKMGVAAADTEDDEVEAIAPHKNFDMVNQHHHVLSTSPDKINIFDLLPGDIGSVTAVQYAPGVESDSQNQTMTLDQSNKPPLGTMQYSDYFADFLPDRSREPPGIESPVPSQSHNDHDILSILNSHKSKKPPTFESSFSTGEAQDVLPPALAHLQWIFKNQPPPKPHISHQQDINSMFLKRKGQLETDTDQANSASMASSDSMMEPEETSNSPLKYQGTSTKELVDFLMKLQNVTKPLSSFDLNAVKVDLKNSSSENSPTENKDAVDFNSHNHFHHGQNASDLEIFANENTTVINYTTKRPAFWKFGNKLPAGAFSINGNTEEALNNRIRKLLTAFGYSALPTIAAGAAATWPFWVPLVATGRRRRRKRSSLFSTPRSITEEPNYFFEEKDKNNDRSIQDLTTEKSSQSFLTKAMTKNTITGNYTWQNDSSTTHHQQQIPSNRQLLSKSTKNSRREEDPNLGGEKKWIKVDVITTSAPFSASTSSPTLHVFDDLNSQSHSHHQHDDVTKYDNNGFQSPSKSNSAKNNRNDNSNSHRNGGKISTNNDDNEEGGSMSSISSREKLGPQQKQRHDEKLDLPLIKDFLKNVLYSEFNIPTKATTAKPPQNNEYKIQPPRYPVTTEPTVLLSQYPIFTSTKNNNNLNKLVIKNGEYMYPTSQHSGGDNKSTPNPFSRPSPATSSLFEMIAGSDKKVISMPQFTTPSPTSVYIHNRGDGLASAISTQRPATLSTTATSLVHWVNENNSHNNNYNKNNIKPWGSSLILNNDKIETNFPAAFANTADALNGPHHTQTVANYRPNNIGYFSNQQQQTNKALHKRKIADSIRAAESTKTDMTNNGQRTIDTDSTPQSQQQQRQQRGTEGSIKKNKGSDNFPPVRSQRRLHKWSSDKTDDLNEGAEENDEIGENDENGPLVQSLSAMASHLMNTKTGNRATNNDEDDEEEDENLENSSERDVYITEKGHGVTVPIDDGENDTEETASEEDSTDQAETGFGGKRKHGDGDQNDVGGEEDDNGEDGRGSEKMSPKLKSDHYSTTPKGLTTWSAVNGPSQMPMYSSKVTVQKIPHDYTISSVLSFSTERPQTTQEMVVIKERVPTTEPSAKITTKVNLLSPSSASSSGQGMKNKRRPYNKNNKKVAPSKFVKPQLEEVTAEVTSIDDTHVVYKTKITTEAPEAKSTGVTDYYDRFTTKRPLWPYQLTGRPKIPTKRPAFSRLTPKPKNPYLNKKPQLLTTPTTTTPPSTTTYIRNPQTSIISPITGLSLNLSNLSLSDFLRSQIIPRIGLTLISFMISTPLLFTLMGAAGLRRRKRSLSSSAPEFSSFNGRALFESIPQRGQTDHFDFSTVQKKLEEALMKQPTRRRVVGNSGSNSNSFDLITEAFRHLAKWWASKNTSSKSRSVNNSIESKQEKRNL